MRTSKSSWPTFFVAYFSFQKQLPLLVEHPKYDNFVHCVLALLLTKTDTSIFVRFVGGDSGRVEGGVPQRWEAASRSERLHQTRASRDVQDPSCGAGRPASYLQPQGEVPVAKIQEYLPFAKASRNFENIPKFSLVVPEHSANVFLVRILFLPK